MPRLTAGKMPAYRHFRARNPACCDIGGKRYYLGPWKSKASLLEYDRLIGEWLTHGRVRPQGEEEERLSVVELIAGYLAHARSYYRRDGREYEAIVMAARPLRALYGREPADAFGPLKLEVVRAE